MKIGVLAGQPSPNDRAMQIRRVTALARVQGSLIANLKVRLPPDAETTLPES